MMHLFKRFVFAALAMFVLMVGEARAEMPQTDVQLVEQMAGADASKVLEALAVYYDLHVSELVVQNMNERRTGSMFAVSRAKAAGKDASKLERNAAKIVAERKARVAENRDLRIKLETISGIEFLDPLVMAPDAPLDKPASIPDGVWKNFETAKAAWQEERMILLEAQQRYDDTRDVSIGDHLRAMTKAEVAFTKAIGDVRLTEAKSAAASGKALAEVLGGL